jgi:hypothetical protein
VSARYPESFAVEWPLRPAAADPIPDDAHLVANAGVSDHPAYIASPDGRLALLPSDPTGRPEWNFGYGGGPRALVSCIARFFTQIDGLGEGQFPLAWLEEQVFWNSPRELWIAARDIRACYPS